MEFSWRTILILIGLLIVAGILIDGLRRMRQARSEALGFDVTEGQGQEEEYNPELPGAGFRVIRSSNNTNTARDTNINDSTRTFSVKEDSAPDTNNNFAGNSINSSIDLDIGTLSATRFDDNLALSETALSTKKEALLEPSLPANNVVTEVEPADEMPSLAMSLTKDASNNDRTPVPPATLESKKIAASMQTAKADIVERLAGCETELESSTIDEQLNKAEHGSIDGVAEVSALLESIKNDNAASQDQAKSEYLLDNDTSDIDVVIADGNVKPNSKAAPQQRLPSMFERLMGDAGVQIDRPEVPDERSKSGLIDSNSDTKDDFEVSQGDTLSDADQFFDSLRDAAPELNAADAADLIAVAKTNVTELNQVAKKMAQVELSPIVEVEETLVDPHIDEEVDGLPDNQVLPINYAADDAEQLARRPEPDLVLVINTIAVDPEGFDGEALLFLLTSCDLRFGEKNIFHRFEQADGRGCIQFSVAQSHEPGIFDPSNMVHQCFTGLTFFMSLPGAKKPLEAYEAMYELAMAVSRNLKADVLDGSFSAMTTQTREHDRQLILDFERKRQLSVKKAQR